MGLAFAVGCTGGGPDRAESTDAQLPSPTSGDSASNRPSGTVTVRGQEFSLADYSPSLPREAIKPVYDPVFVTAEEAGLDEQEMVLGLEINGESRAYPVGPLHYREMVNDEVGADLFLNLVDSPRFLPKFADPIFDAALVFLTDELERGRQVLIHCNEGRSRAPEGSRRGHRGG